MLDAKEAVIFTKCCLLAVANILLIVLHLFSYC